MDFRCRRPWRIPELIRAEKRRFIQVQPVKRMMLVFAGPAGVPLRAAQARRVRQSRLIFTVNSVFDGVEIRPLSFLIALSLFISPSLLINQLARIIR